MVRLYGRAGRLTAENGGFRPGQSTSAAGVLALFDSGELLLSECDFLAPVCGDSGSGLVPTLAAWQPVEGQQVRGSSPSFLVTVHPPQQFVDSGLAPGEAGYSTPLPLDHGVPRTPIQGMTEERLQMVRSRTPAARSLLSYFLSIRALSPPAPACGRGRCTLYSTVATAPANHLATTPTKPLSIIMFTFRCGCRYV
jgi:hypothetical protein